MAEVIGLGASILGIADAGLRVTTALYRFSKSYSSADTKVEGIASTVAVTAAILTKLGNVVNEHPDDLHKMRRWSVFPDTIAACQKQYDGIEKALQKARPGNMRPWQKLVFALGGDEEIEELLIELERTKSNLELLLGAVNYDILRRLEKANELSPQLAEQLAEIKAILPWLVSNIALLGGLQNPGNGGSNDDTTKVPPQSNVLTVVPVGEPGIAPFETPGSNPGKSPALNNTSIARFPNGQSDGNQDGNYGRGQPSTWPHRLGNSQGSPRLLTEASPNQAKNPDSNKPPKDENTAYDGPSQKPLYPWETDMSGPFYEAWSLIYQKETRQKKASSYDSAHEISISYFPIKLTVAPVSVKPPRYSFIELRIPSSQLRDIVTKKNPSGPPISDILTSLPAPAQRAVNKLLQHRSYRRPSIEMIEVRKSFWKRMTSRGSNPSLVIYLKCDVRPSSTEQKKGASIPSLSSVDTDGLYDGLDEGTDADAEERPERPVPGLVNYGPMSGTEYARTPGAAGRLFGEPVAYQSEVKPKILLGETMEARPRQKSPTQRMPTEDEAEKLMDEFLAGLEAEDKAQRAD
ncbi:uncharacterized protein Z518_07243 [Rhinocladiella mackenziei CBS 650.93]|uniref:Fungal N-terminal domain-containing protein n=1 Tax=Rhinocladiella mackenziei CBS 650.93 TaxID=1442369 RepID=A0A0D2J3X1_9EURO|nr:uncharacterized protein Z518_07243 [Rhinocladiella mackenziei CBS 650.93]KIX03690.1 hypothetical protein Z518_07243 [Rhinocladiella mackenziei CBS 650.93]